MINLKLNVKLLFLVKIFLIYFFICVNSYADNSKTLDNLIVLGIDEAPIKIKVFSSLTCPHCASFHLNVVPEIKKRYIDIGKVQLIFIDFPLDKVAFNASILLNCIDQKQQISFLDNIYKSQPEWTSGSNIDEINNNLKKTVKIFGIDSKQFDKCLNDDTISDRILIGRMDGEKKYSINSTPTIVINEKKLKGSTNLKNIIKKIEKLI